MFPLSSSWESYLSRAHCGASLRPCQTCKFIRNLLGVTGVKVCTLLCATFVLSVPLWLDRRIQEIPPQRHGDHGDSTEKHCTVPCDALKGPTPRTTELSPRFRRLRFHPRTIVLGNVQYFQLIPSQNRLLSRGVCFRGQIVTHEVDISPVRNLGEGLLVLTQLDVFLDQASIGELDAPDELLFPPTVESIAHTRSSLQAWSKFQSLSLKKSLTPHECWNLFSVGLKCFGGFRQ